MLHHVTSPDGVRIACEVSGEGRPLVLVHGAGSGRWGFDALRPLLERSFRVIAVDRRGRGDSDDGSGDYSMEAEFGDIAAVVADAGEDAALCGHSYGGLVAAGAAARLPELEKLVLYEPPMGGVLASEGWIARFEAHLEIGNRPAAVREFLRDIAGYSDAEIDELQDLPVWPKRLEVAPTVPRELWAELGLSLDRLDPASAGARCLMLVGSESPQWARTSTKAYAAALRDVSVRQLEGHGHGGIAAAPDLVARELTEFLSD